MLHKNKEWFQSILSSLHETAIVVLDKEGYIVSLWGNPEMDRRYGVPASDVVGKSVRDILPPEQVTQTLTLIQHIFNTGEKLLVERPVTLPGGDFWQETSFCPMLDKSGNVTEVVGYIRDITKRKKMEELLLQSEKMKSLGIITSGIAHEFNNVLAIIQGFAHLLKKKHGDRKKMEQNISKIIDAVANGTEIVRRMDEFVNAKKDTTDFISINMMDMLRQAIDLTKPRWENIAQTKGVIYDIDTKGGGVVPARMTWSPARAGAGLCDWSLLVYFFNDRLYQPGDGIFIGLYRDINIHFFRRLISNWPYARKLNIVLKCG